jgi:hypothetical protein
MHRLSLPGAWFAAFVFALHPVQVESVAWMTELKNTLSTPLYLCAALAYLKFDNTRRSRHWLIAIAFFVLALLSKTVTSTLPISLLVLAWWKRGQIRWREDVLPVVPFFGLAIAAGAMTAWVEHAFIGAQGAEFALSPIERVLVAGRAVWFYMASLIWPFRAGVSVPAVDRQRYDVVAVPLSGVARRVDGGSVAAARPHAWAAGRPAALRGGARTGARLCERVPVPVQLRRGSLSSTRRAWPRSVSSQPH